MRILLSLLLVAGPFAQPVYDPSKILFWNGQAIVYPENTVSTFHSKWANYLGEDDWREIDTDFYPVDDGFAMTEAPFKAFAPQFSDGEAVFHNDNKWDIVNQKEITDPPLDMTIKALKVHKVEGKIVKSDLVVATGLQKDVNYVLYENAYRDADLIYYVDFGKEPRLMKLVRFHKEPKRFKYQFLIKYSEDVVFNFPARGREWVRGETRTFQGENNSISVFRKGSDVRGIGFWRFRIWDSRIPELDEPQRNMRDITVKMKYLGENTFLQTKVLPKDLFKNAQYPVYTDTTSTFFPDPDPESATVDGTVIRGSVNETLATLRSSAGTGADDVAVSLSVALTSSVTSNQYSSLFRTALLFDTSSISDTDTIDTATLSFQASAIAFNGLGGESSVNSALVVVQGDTASNTALASGDYDRIFTTGTVDFGRSDIQVNIPLDGTFEDVTLNASGEANVNVTGISKYALRQGWDLDNTTTGLTWAASTNQGFKAIRSADTAGTADDPKLVVVHSAAGASRRIFYAVDE